MEHSKCGARNRAGKACGNPPWPNGRCRFHGGPSTGPRTAEGRERFRIAHTKHGWYGEKGRKMRMTIAYLKAESRAIIERVE